MYLRSGQEDYLIKRLPGIVWSVQPSGGTYITYINLHDVYLFLWHSEQVKSMYILQLLFSITLQFIFVA